MSATDSDTTHSAHPDDRRPAADAVQLCAVDDGFARAHPHLADPHLCVDRCIEASTAFVAACHDAGISATTVVGARFGEDPHFPGVRLMLNAHTAVVLDDNTVYDWTARQFDPSAQWPTVISLSQWRQVWLDTSQW